MTTRIIRLTALVIALLTPLAPARAGWRGGIGVLGDSYSDEYQFYPPHRSTARNWVEILAATRGLNFGRFSTRSRGEPRNQGYEYNWARSDATTDDLIATGQHTGLAAQVARGEVNLVVVFIGGNDFINAMKTPTRRRHSSKSARVPRRTTSAPWRQSSRPTRTSGRSSLPCPISATYPSSACRSTPAASPAPMPMPSPPPSGGTTPGSGLSRRVNRGSRSSISITLRGSQS